jgi:rhodanese-related sulfurtransferase
MSVNASISLENLTCLIGAASGPALIDVRSDEDFSADPTFIPGAVRRNYASVAKWADIFHALSAIEVGQKCAKCAHGVAARLRHAGAHALKLEGGHEAWPKTGMPMTRKPSDHPATPSIIDAAPRLTNPTPHPRSNSAPSNEQYVL